MTNRVSSKRPKLRRCALQLTPELHAFVREHYPVSGSGDILQAFVWRDAQGHQRRVQLYFADGLQLDARFGAPRNGQQTIGSFRMKWQLAIRKEAA